MSGQDQTVASSMKAERDRFVALAFCWADILFELDEAEKILFAGGATSAILGVPDEKLIGQSICTVIADEDQALISQMLKLTRSQGRVDDIQIRLAGRAGKATPPVTMTGYRLQDLGGHYFVAMRLGRAFSKNASLSRDMSSGLLDADSFADAALDRMKEFQDRGEEVKMTMLDLGNMDSLHDKLDDEGRAQLENTIGTTLRASSADGDSAGKLADGKYSLLHREDADIDALQDQIAQYTREADPDGAGLEVKSATLEVDSQDISDEDLANGLLFTINRFKNSRGKDFTVQSLQTSMSTLVSEAMSSVNEFRRVVNDADFYVAFQPIIEARTGVIHHYEALARFRGNKEGQSPYEYIVFAEETGLISEFDMAMARKVMNWLGQQPKGKNYSVAVNVSGYSVGDLAYVNELQSMLNDNPWSKGKLMFEITESSRMSDLDSANKFIQSLRKAGYEVCLDDFGAGAASFSYLASLEVDVVKLDGSAVHGAMKAPKGRAFLRALGNLCRDLKVETIAEMIDDPKGLEFVRNCGIGYVQGYLFGKPSPNVEAFNPFPNNNLFARARQSRASMSAR